jgi:GNAT superfamily N-acetyltransferase
MCRHVQPTPWDDRALGVDTYEILYESDIQFKQIVDIIVSQRQFGHYTVKVDPLTVKKTLHKLGFFYCDTLIEPYCTQDQFIAYFREEVSVSEIVELDTIDKISDQRYSLWLKDLWERKEVYSLMHLESVAGFFAFSRNKILLHALSESFRGKGLAKYFWSAACEKLFSQGFSELISSISASNLAVLNLYASLGFRFRKPLDVYHWLFEE